MWAINDKFIYQLLYTFWHVRYHNVENETGEPILYCICSAGYRAGFVQTAAALPRAEGGVCQWELLHRQETSCYQLD